MEAIKKNRYYSMFFWNSLGMICNAGTSFLLLIFVTRICGDVNAGIFALGYANAQLMLSIGRYGMRSYQATDIKDEISFSTYFMSRIITCILMMIISFLSIVWNGYSFYKGAIVYNICIIKMADALEDVFHGLFQQHGRIDLAGKYLTYRNIITIGAFIGILIISKDLMLTCILTGILSVIACLVINIPTARCMAVIKPELNKLKLSKLLVSCFPLFAGSFLALYITNVPKYMIDMYLMEDIQAYFNILFMPTFVINLFSEFIFKPLLTDIAIKWDENRLGEFLKYIFRFLLGILILTVLAVGGGYLCGCELLSLIYGVDLLNYRKELTILLISGGFSAVVYLLFHVLTALRRQVSLLAGYGLAAILVTLLGPGLVRRFNMFGACVLCIISTIILVLFFAVILVNALIKKYKTTG